MITKRNRDRLNVIQRHVSLLVIATLVALVVVGSVYAQTPSPTPTAEETLYNGYRVNGVFEFGWRWVRLDGNENKYRSDLNYKQGFRSFDGNILFQSESGKGKYFDSLLISNSGWGTDPSGYLRVNMEKTGIYKFNGSLRKVNYFNNLANHAAYNNIGYHTQDWKQWLSDFDVTLLPQNEKLRINLGASFNDTSGPGVWTSRGYRDDFWVPQTTKLKSDDFRIGAEGKLMGFNWGLTQGFRIFRDRSYMRLTAPNAGFNTSGPNTTVFDTYNKNFPVDGNSYFTQGNINRTFAKKFDFTGRFIYSSTDSTTNVNETFTGRDNNNNYIDSDNFNYNGGNKRIQSRFDVGFTWRATNNFRISDTVSHDQFAVNTGMRLFELLLYRNSANTISYTQTVNAYGFRIYDYKRLANTLEADYQFNNALSMHVGWRYSKRETSTTGSEGSFTVRTPPATPAPTPSSLLINESEENSANVFIAGMKIKPTKGWVIFWDVEHGAADNVFSRLENYDFTNFRVRSRWSYKTVVVNVSAISKDNNNPSMTIDPTPVQFGTDIKSRVYTGDVSWNPIESVSINGGYSYREQTAKTPVYIYLPARTLGLSEYYVRDHYAFIDVAVRVNKRVKFYGSYRANRDEGQGDRVSPLPPTSANIVGSYPMHFNTPEVRAAFRITRNVDWNIGYQYYDYKDVQTPVQNYKAHLPYTSLKIYFGGGAADR